jgi:hypothetical protein
LKGECISIRTFADDGQWKLYREGELVAVYASRPSAERAAVIFAEELSRFGKNVELVFVQDDGSEIFSNIAAEAVLIP